MSYKTILAVHTAEEAPANLLNAIELAKKLDAHLDILVLGMLTPPSIAVHGLMVDDYWGSHFKEVREQTEARVKKIEEITASHEGDVTITSECMDLAEVDFLITRKAICSDLAVFSNGSMSLNSFASKAFNETLMDTGVPVLVLGDPEKNPAAPASAVIAWDGSTQSAKAIRTAVSLLGKCKNIELVSVEPAQYSLNAVVGDEMEHYLARHGVAVTPVKLPHLAGDVSEQIFERARDANADLVIMGGYGHSRWREWFLGGTTKSSLQQTEFPVLMAH